MIKPFEDYIIEKYKAGAKLFKINAGYCKDHVNKNFYYILARNKTEAKRKVLKIFSNFFKIYKAEECTASEVISILSQSENYNIFST